MATKLSIREGRTEGEGLWNPQETGVVGQERCSAAELWMNLEDWV